MIKNKLMSCRSEEQVVLRRMRDCLKFLTVTFAIANFQMACAEPAGTDSTAQPGKRWIYSPVEYWQSYSQSGSNGVHKFIESDHAFKIKKLRPPEKDFRTGYAFIYNGMLFFEDRANDKSYKQNWLGTYNTVKTQPRKTYRAAGYIFHFTYYSDFMSACPLSHDSECKIIKFHPATFPYVFAKKEGAVISITNYGDALLFKDGNWCRMSMHDEVYSCTDPEATPLTAPRKIQFYSSINYRGRVLLGEWPTGRLYEFDGKELKPSNMTPPEIAKLSDKRLGYEAQTMAEYCGDLFVGYWPKGEVWRYDHHAKEWQLFKRFFSEDKGETFIPHSDRVGDAFDSSFFGQRVTAMVPYKDALYIATSNLNTWTSSKPAPATIDPSRVAEYGAIYKVTKPGCATSYDYAKKL
ncbi:hypothetical protein [Pseudomonas gessardii]|uniref:hypothetical protein n=1 Tax=Pseudomonas gessardii TaxID=78544 RepID=UPI001475BCB3|nr:hypothetical protein [Pseudomonas gessardii]NNA89715.1 hypothetical protein [Pseudomonas gessardii]